MPLKNCTWILAVVLAATAMASAQTAPNKIWPPWSAPPTDGVNFTIQQIDNVPDLHGDIVDPQLVVFFAGNQFMATAELMQTFRQEHPEVKRIFWETLPPGILAKQIEEGALIIGNLRIAIQPDIYTAGQRRVDEMRKQGKFEQVVTYASNQLAIMVGKGNPKHVQGLKDLARADVRVSMPNPAWEGVANLIIESYKKAGGEGLNNEIMQKKVQNGGTFLTQIHHRQTPLRIMRHESDAGVTWYSEARFQQMIGNPIDMVEIPPSKNMTGVYMAGVLKDAPHAKLAREFAAFLVSPSAQAIFKKYGFQPPPRDRQP